MWVKRHRGFSGSVQQCFELDMQEARAWNWRCTGRGDGTMDGKRRDEKMEGTEEGENREGYEKREWEREFVCA